MCVEFRRQIQSNKHENTFFPKSLCCYSCCIMMTQTYRGSEPNHTIINNRLWKDLWGKDEPKGERTTRVCVAFTSFWLASVSMANVSVISALLLMEMRGGKFHLFLSGTLAFLSNITSVMFRPRSQHMNLSREPITNRARGQKQRRPSWLRLILMQLRRSDVITSPDDITGWHHQRRRVWATLQDTLKVRNWVEMQVRAGHSK